MSNHEIPHFLFYIGRTHFKQHNLRALSSQITLAHLSVSFLSPSDYYLGKQASSTLLNKSPGSHDAPSRLSRRINGKFVAAAAISRRMALCSAFLR